MERRLDRGRQCSWGASLLLASALLASFLVTSPWRLPVEADGAAMWATAESLLYRRSLAIADGFAADMEVTPSARRGPDGRAYAKYGPGLSLVEVPVLVAADATAGAFGVPPTTTRAVLFPVMNPLIAVIACLMAASLATDLGASRRDASAVAVATGLSTLLLHHATTDGADVLLTALLTGAVWSAARFVSRGAVSLAWFCGALLGYAILTKPLLVVVVPAFAAAMLFAHGTRSRVTGLAAIGLGSAAGVGATLWLNAVRFGSPWATGYNEPVMTGDLVTGLVGLTIGVNKGLLWYAPPAALGAIACCRALRSHPAAGVAILGSGLLLTGATARFYDWGGGWTWGPRYLLPLVPALVAANAPRLGGRPWRTAFWVAYTVGVIASGLGSVIDNGAYRRTTVRAWLPEVSGVARVGDTLRPGQTVDVVLPAEDRVPEFSAILGHWWLARVAAEPCDCSTPVLACGCRHGEFHENPVFLRPPWRARFPDVEPTVPYGASLVRPALLRALYREAVFDPAPTPRGQSGHGPLGNSTLAVRLPEVR
jgi:hypothetical protein